ncbi:DUF4180 domain-containing protein [Spirosoma knui]
MEIDLQTIHETTIAVILSNDVVIKDAQDALDLLANCAYQGAEKIIINQQNLSPDFFELQTGLAGEILQKFSNYRMQLAVVGDYSEYTSKSLRDFIRESNKMGRISFVDSLDEAKEKLLV